MQSIPSARLGGATTFTDDLESELLASNFAQIGFNPSPARVAPQGCGEAVAQTKRHGLVRAVKTRQGVRQVRVSKTLRHIKTPKSCFSRPANRHEAQVVGRFDQGLRVGQHAVLHAAQLGGIGRAGGVKSPQKLHHPRQGGALCIPRQIRHHLGGKLGQARACDATRPDVFCPNRRGQSRKRPNAEQAQDLAARKTGWAHGSSQFKSEQIKQIQVKEGGRLAFKLAIPSCTSGPPKPINSSARLVSNAGPAWRSQLLSEYFVQRMAVWLPAARRSATS